MALFFLARLQARLFLLLSFDMADLVALTIRKILLALLYVGWMSEHRPATVAYLSQIVSEIAVFRTGVLRPIRESRCLLLATQLLQRQR